MKSPLVAGKERSAPLLLPKLRLTAEARTEFFYLTMLFGFAGPALFAVPVGPFHLFPFRICLLLLTPIFCIEVTRSGSFRRFSGYAKLSLGFMFFWLIYAYVSAFWAPAPGAAIQNLIHLSTGILVVLMVPYYLTTTQKIARLAWLWIIAYSAFVGIGLWEITTGNHLPVSGLYQWENPYPTVERFVRIQYLPSAVFKNPNDLATFLMLGIALLLVWTSRNTGLWKRAVGGLLLALGIVVLVYTESRANYIAVALILGAWLGIRLMGYGRRGSFGLLVLLLLIFVASIVIVPTSGKLVDFVMEELASTASFQQNIRIVLYHKAIEGLVASYWFGLGSGGAEVYLARFVHLTGGITNIHNWWLEIAVNYGLFIFVGYCTLYCSLLLKTFGMICRSSHPTHGILAEFTFLGLIGLTIGSFSSSSLIQFLPYWMFLGITIAVGNTYRLATRSALNQARRATSIVNSSD